VSESIVGFLYDFGFPNGRHERFRVDIDRRTRTIVNSLVVPDEYASYVQYGFYRCLNCTRDEPPEADCPVARNLIAVTAPFRDDKSYEPVRVEVVAPRRTYVRDTSLQQGLQSLFGLVMSSSGCCHLGFLGPMALHHLPFADENETMFRVIGLYLRENWFRTPNEPLSLDGLHERYQRIETVNRGIAERVAAIENQDAGKNALVILDTFSKMFSLEYERGLERFRQLFTD